MLSASLYVGITTTILEGGMGIRFSIPPHPAAVGRGIVTSHAAPPVPRQAGSSTRVARSPAARRKVAPTPPGRGAPPPPPPPQAGGRGRGCRAARRDPPERRRGM